MKFKHWFGRSYCFRFRGGVLVLIFDGDVLFRLLRHLRKLLSGRDIFLNCYFDRCSD